MADTDDREFDVVLWGATGFVGRLTAEYLAENYGDSLRWAIAGRNERKLEALRGDLDIGDLPIILGDSFDRESLDAMASRTRVVCTTVGPYAKYGDELVAACVEHRTDYCDLTGELQWIRRMMDAHHQRAKEVGARIVHCCGFDSIPSDLGTLMVNRFAESEYGAPCTTVKLVVRRLRGEFSGGTFASMTNLMEEVREHPEIRKILGHPYSLNPPGDRSGPDGSDQATPRYDEDADAWTGPFIMEATNARVVRRSNALLDYPYGRDFRYGETMAFGKGPGAAAKAAGMAVGIGAFMAAASIGPVRELLNQYVLPAPGEGPTREKIEGGFFDIELHGHGRADGEPFDVLGRVTADRDPGYGATAIMLAESAICLAENGDGLDGGILTPASALGRPLVDRLRDAGMIFDVTSN